MKERQKKVVLSIGVLVSNRKNTVKKCLDSLKPIREAIPCQLIITDTGCDTELRAILEEYADTMTEFTWCSDFAKARNANMSHAIGEWYLYLDDDEWFVDTEQLIDFFMSGSYHTYDGACYIVRNYQCADGSMYSDDYLSRMIKLTTETHFVGKIHEYLVPIPKNNCLLNSWADHYGYAFKNEEETQKHYERNSKLLLEMIKEEPNNQRWWTHLAQEYISIRDGDKLRQLAEDGLHLVDQLDDIESTINRGTFYMCAIVAYECDHDDEKECEACDRTLADPRNTRLCMAFAKWWKAHCYMRMGKYKEAEKYLKDYFKEYQYFIKNENEHIIQKQGLIVGQCYDDIKVTEAYEMLITAGLKQNNTSYLNQYLNKLPWKKGNGYLYEGFMEATVEAMINMNEKKNFVQMIRMIHSNVEVWEAFCNEIGMWKLQERPQLDKVLELCQVAGYKKSVSYFLEWKMIEHTFKNGLSAISYPEYKTWFIGFAENVLEFYKDAYEQKFEEQTELPGACLMAMMIEDAMGCEDNKDEFLKIMKQCPEVYPELSNQVKMLLMLYLREPMRKAQEAKEEMEKIKQQVLEQAKQMEKTERFDEAIQIVQQLKTVIPNDLEMMALDLEIHLNKLEKNVFVS